MDIQALLRELIDRDGSDLYITTDSPPLIRAEGVNRPVGDRKLGAADTEALADSVMSADERTAFAEAHELNLALELPGIGRFRVNIHRQRAHVGMVIRQVKTTIPTLEQMGLPGVFEEIIMQKRGLILVTGATGSGKTTTLAAMLNHRNENSSGHIVTVEDPIEFIHPNKGCIFTQREVGTDTHTFNTALKNALRQAPDVILIGEIRDRETMEAAITFADTGHLCIGTLHSSNAYQTLHRVMNLFPGERHDEIYLQLSLCLRAIISQRLVPSVDGRRVAAVEILRDTPLVKDLIKSGQVDKVKDGMKTNGNGACQTFDQDLLKLFERGRITGADAMANADNPNDLRLSLQQAKPVPQAEPLTLAESVVEEEPETGAAAAGEAPPAALELAARPESATDTPSEAPARKPAQAADLPSEGAAPNPAQAVDSPSEAQARRTAAGAEHAAPDSEPSAAERWVQQKLAAARQKAANSAAESELRLESDEERRGRVA